jgi:hypothetical protein
MPNIPIVVGNEELANVVVPSWVKGGHAGAAPETEQVPL